MNYYPLWALTLTDTTGSGSNDAVKTERHKMQDQDILREIDKARVALIETRLAWHTAQRAMALEQLHWLMAKLETIKTAMQQLHTP